jgi:hypothetical protein
MYVNAVNCSSALRPLTGAAKSYAICDRFWHEIAGKYTKGRIIGHFAGLNADSLLQPTNKAGQSVNQNSRAWAATPSFISPAGCSYSRNQTHFRLAKDPKRAGGKPWPAYVFPRGFELRAGNCLEKPQIVTNCDADLLSRHPIFVVSRETGQPGGSLKPR